MKEWKITDNNHSYKFLKDRVTFFKGSNVDWEFLLNDLESYFSKKNSLQYIQIYESNTLLAKNDFHFLKYIPKSFSGSDEDFAYEYHKKRFLNLLEFSPFYSGLVESWEELREEVELLSESISPSLIKFSLPQFQKKFVDSKINLELDHLAPLTLVEKILFELDMLTDSLNNKRLVIALILTSEFISENEYQSIVDELNNQNSGYNYLVISDYTDEKNRNILSGNRVLNILDVFEIKEVLREHIPLIWDQDKFINSANLYIELVDNFRDNIPFLSLGSVDNLEFFIYVYSIFILLKTPLIIDLEGIPSSFQEYFDSLLLNRL